MLVWSEPTDWDTCARDGGIAVDEAGGLRLAASHLITHEPGAFSTQHGEELYQNVQAKVSFDLGETLPQGADCYFYAREEQDNQWPLIVTVNGHVQTLGPGTPLAGEFAWHHVRLPRQHLRPGQNTVRFACESPAANAWILSVDTSVPNVHSRKSTDGGQSWQATGLGLEGALSGEYVVRLRVREHPARGTITSSILNVATLFQSAPLVLHWHAVTPPGTRVALRYRTGKLQDIEDTAWRDVVNAAADSSENTDSDPDSDTGQSTSENDEFGHVELPQPAGPCAQWQAELSSNDSSETPILRGAALLPKDASPDETRPVGKLSCAECKAAPSYTFTHQDPAEPKLEILRNQEGLAEIIAGGATQWEQVLALRSWVAVQWVHRAPHEFRRCCPWDALTILAWMRADRGHGQPQPDAYCTHYAIVLAQCALALGWQARLWVMSAEPTLHTNGHFVAEIWSAVHEKWVMLDADTDSHIERAGEPLSVLEIHDAWREGKLDELSVIAGANADKVKIGPDWVEEMLPLGLYRFCGLVLRNNHLSTLIPGPVEHGWTTYKWDGFLWWRDGAEPELPFFSLSSNRRADFDWEAEE
ncbi:MAG: hypothetical protein OXK81_05750 [Chloroflexota bacterium]|nr:hypothetical protein [Chloroflexota bacterium]MDE2930303.1 hypothetical protein [Chloroflexota bacterium]